MSSDETIMPSDVGADENSSTPNGSPATTESRVQEAPPESDDAPWATSHFEVMMGKTLYGAILDAETDDLIAQVEKRNSTSIHDLREREGISGKVIYLTEGEDGDERRIELSLKESANSKGEETEESDMEKLVGTLREEIRSMRSEQSPSGPGPDADKDDLWDQINTLRERLSKMRDEKQNLLDDLDEAEGKLRKVRNEKRSEIATLRDKREEFRVKFQQMKRERDRLERQLEDAEERAEELEDTVTSLRDRNDRLKSKVANVGDEEDGAADGFWARLFERLLGEDGMLSDVDGTAISRVMAQLSQQQAQSQPQQVPAGAAGQMQRSAGAPQVSAQNGGGAVHRAPQQPGGQGGQPPGAQQAQQAGQSQQGQPSQQSQNQPEEMMDRDEAIGDLFKRIIEDSVGRLQGSFSEEDIQESAALVSQRLDEYRTQQGFEIQPHEWSQLLIELTAAVDRMDIEGGKAEVFCHKLWPMLQVFSDQLEVVNNFPPELAATTLQNFYESSDQMLLGNKIQVTDSMHDVLAGVIGVLADHLGTGQRPGGQPSADGSGSGGEEGQGALPDDEQNELPPGL